MLAVAPLDHDEQVRLLLELFRSEGWVGGVAVLTPATLPRSLRTGGGFLLAHPFLLLSPGEADTAPLYVVDPQFADLFDIARPTAEFSAFHATLSRVFVGTEKKFAQAVQFAADRVNVARLIGTNTFSYH